MGHKKNNISRNQNIQNQNNSLSNFKLFNKFNEKWDFIFNFCISYFTQNNYSKNIINIVKTIHSNKSFCLIIFILASWFWSNLILNLFYCFMLVDSLVISLLILQNHCVETNSRRLAKNVILIALASMNIIGGIMTLGLVSFIYMEYSKFIGRLIFKFIKFIIKIFGNVFPPIHLLYPDIRLFNFEDPDMTIRSDKKVNREKNVSKKYNKHINILKPSSSDSESESESESNLNYTSDSSSDSSSDSESSAPSTKSEKIKKQKMIKSKKNIKPKVVKKTYNTKNKESTYPTISTIKYDVFKDHDVLKKIKNN